MDFSNLRSNFDNCILYNAIVKNEHSRDEWEIKHFTDFIINGLESQVSEYYRRSENIISKMRELGVDTDETWIEIDFDLVDLIFECIDEQGFYGHVDAYKQLQETLTILETKYEVN